MPKVTDTRQQRAFQLLARLEIGPSFAPHIGPEAFTPQYAEEAFRLWAQTYVLEELKSLVPELRNLKTPLKGIK